MKISQAAVRACIAALTLGLLVHEAKAVTIITPSAATSATGNLSGRPIGETINGSGLSGVGDILEQTHAVNSGNSGLYWIGNLAGASLEFGLPGASAVDAVHLWSYSRTGEIDRGIQSFDISFSTDGGSNFGTPISISGVLIETYPDPIEVQSFNFAPQTGVTDIRINNIVNHGDPTYVGLSEIRFSAVPEPAPLALLGLGGLWLLARRRR